MPSVGTKAGTVKLENCALKCLEFCIYIYMVLAEPNHHPDSLAVIPEENFVQHLLSPQHKKEWRPQNWTMYQP